MYKEIRGDIFKDVSSNSQIHYAQCISNDLAMGAGIAVKFNHYFNTKAKLHDQKQEYKKTHNKMFSNLCDCIYIEPVFNIIIKEKFWNKPTQDDFNKAINNFINTVIQTKQTEKIKEIRCPMLGCGLDKLEWKNVKPILEKTARRLQAHNIDLVIYKLK